MLFISYVHNVCMHYKIPLLSRVAAQQDVCLHGFFGQSHWKRSKLRTVAGITAFPLTILPTLDVRLPYKGGRGLHIFWNPTLPAALHRFRPDVIVAGNSNFPNNISVMLYARRFGVYGSRRAGPSPFCVAGCGEAQGVAVGREEGHPVRRSSGTSETG